MQENDLFCSPNIIWPGYKKDEAHDIAEPEYDRLSKLQITITGLYRCLQLFTLQTEAFFHKFF